MLDCDCAAVVSGSCGRCIDRATIDRLAFERNEAVASALRFSEQHDALLAALTDAASSLKWIAEESRDETASNIRAYAHSREGVARAAIAKAGGCNG